MAELQELQDIVQQQRSTSPFSERQLFQPDQAHFNPIRRSEALDHRQNVFTDFVSSKNWLADILQINFDKKTFSDLCSKVNDCSTDPSC